MGVPLAVRVLAEDNVGLAVGEQDCIATPLLVAVWVSELLDVCEAEGAWVDVPEPDRVLACDCVRDVD